MRVAIVNRLFWIDGAIPLTVRNLVKNLSKLGIKTVVFTSDVKESDSDGMVTFVKVPTRKIAFFDLSGWIFAFFLFFKLIALYRKLRFNIVQVHDSTAFYGAWLFCKLYKVPNIIFMHACIFEKGKKGMYPKTREIMYKINTKFYLKHADCIACISKKLTRWARYLGADKDKVRFIPEPVDFSLFKPQDVIHRDGRTILFVGRASSPEKGLRYLLEAMPYVLSVFPDLKLVIVGETKPDTKASCLIRQLGIQGNVIYEGKVPHHELSKYYARADVLIIPSLSEGLPKVLIEALACGTPVIATKVGGIPEVIRDGYNGLLIEPGKPEEIAKVIIRVFSDFELLDTLSSRVRRSVQNFSWDKAISEFLKMYEELLCCKDTLQG